eukprot:14195563-Ditylum_brightwellii.AAC.1
METEEYTSATTKKRAEVQCANIFATTSDPPPSPPPMKACTVERDGSILSIFGYNNRSKRRKK